MGRLSAFRSADVNARIAGVLLKRAYVEGSEVKQGQLLFEIDPAPLKAELAGVTAQLAKDQAASMGLSATDVANAASLMLAPTQVGQMFAEGRVKTEEKQPARDASASTRPL